MNLAKKNGTIGIYESFTFSFEQLTSKKCINKHCIYKGQLTVRRNVNAYRQLFFVMFTGLFFLKKS